MSKIVSAVAKIMGEVGSVKKDGENKFHNYKYATASDILHKLQPLLAKEGLVVFQNECQRELIADGAALTITYEFVLAHKEGETWPDKPRHTGMASARNSKGGFDDKAANKCHTAARKYFLLALFQIPTGDYDDADQQEDAPPVASAPKPRAVNPQPVEAPVDPQTGECSPHKITAGDAVKWGGLLVAAVNIAQSEAEIDEWLAKNKEGLETLEGAAPKVHARVKDRVAEKRATFKQKAA